MKPEVLSPAGNLEKLKFAIDFGADAVYLGGKLFNLRAKANNFTVEEMAEGIEYAHRKGRKVYVTLNAFARNDDFEGIKNFVKEVKELEPDAFIVSDLGVLLTVKEIAPEVDIHISTQSNVTNYKAVKVYQELGASRIVLARELSIEEIKEIKDRVPNMEVEVFVHGAMCMAYSGRCLLSNYLSYRESNKGACSQSCRWKYYLVEETRPGEFIPIEEDEKGTYIFNSKDLCALPLLEELIDAGVDSLKIEGRVKSAYYVAVTTSVYRKAVDLILNDREAFKKELPLLLEELKKISHRPYTIGFLSGNKENLQHYETSSYIRNYKFLAVFKNGKWNVRNALKVGDEVEVFTPDAKTKKTIVKDIQILRKDKFENVKIAHPNQIAILKFENVLEIPENAILRKKSV
ncbi:peptidase U32 [Desulfurobacterium thermolithotrophum DSM 11699]|uniref:Peptidase U32 n=1 Tax=Desulfurobacterium thermolithotrophum (strain DSM 11699 / BSA) TaxID=868864 RepID=F0S1U7_DESTD|nr:U32 family peptidase C-terminal domain-containing protein [Desulfurobacterium thermolithotrophum]ADY72952.1 peptidase U32 [Desulfurobacterium thermolithotrophum DSM 11699]